MEITIIDHVGLNVRDLQLSSDWYIRVLGFRIVHTWETTWMLIRGTTRLGLFLRPTALPLDDIDKFIAVNHFAFKTDARGLIEAFYELQALGVPIDPLEDTGVAYSVFFRDPDGYQLEITTYYATDGPKGPDEERALADIKALIATDAARAE